MTATPASGTSTSRLSKGTRSTPQVVADDHDGPEEHRHGVGAHRSGLHLARQPSGLEDDLPGTVDGPVDNARIGLPQHVLRERLDWLDHGRVVHLVDVPLVDEELI